MKILMVCLGNICRSPLAHGILQEKVNTLKLDWEIESAGTGSWHIGNLPDPRSIEVAQTHGIDITYQKARQFRSSDFDDYDLIFAMDSSNYQNILKASHVKEDHKKVHLIMNLVEPGRNISVPDPYWDDNGFEKVYQMLDKATDVIIDTYAS